ncbi:DegT/DnrJ/EryC1/StrS family aminotransferase [candidate division KSB1 bacterium]|nr:DegT/DnrJ/EryC1/StrS family aminotransferase [candidate division KSB1 bacterium]
MKKLALLGGKKSVQHDPGNLFRWPIVTPEHEEAVLDVLRTGRMSGIDVSKKFEAEYAQQLGRSFALTYPSGTSAILGGFYGLGVGVGHEVIAPSLTYWASVLQVYSLGATPVFAEVDSETLCIDPRDVEQLITERTRAIVAVHYTGMPADIDALKKIADRHNLPILEDCSHAHGALYKGRPVGTLTQVAGFSLMSGKSFAIGEGGMLFTDDRKIYERAILFGHYIRDNEILDPDLQPFSGLPAGGYKHRMHQLSSAFGRVQLKYYPDQMREIDRAMNYFCDALEELAGIYPIRPRDTQNTKGGWYLPLCRYEKSELGGLSLQRFAHAIQAEGSVCHPGANTPMHLHPLFSEMDVYGHGKPTRFAHLPDTVDRSLYLRPLPVTEGLYQKLFQIPWFKQFDAKKIDEHIAAYHRVVADYKSLLPGDDGDDSRIGGFSSFFREQQTKVRPHAPGAAN